MSVLSQISDIIEIVFGWFTGYCVLDHVMTMTFGEVGDDVMNNPGEIDQRLLQHKTNDAPIVYLGSIAEFIKEGVDKPAENR